MRDVEDLRVAVDEMSAALIESADDPAELEIAYRVVGDALEVEGRCPAPGASGAPSSCTRWPESCWR